MIKQGRLWPWALGGVLATTMAGNFWVMRLAGADASFAVEPDYYRKAVTWDSTMAQAARNAELGWQLEAGLAPPGANGQAELSVSLRAADGAPIPNATIRVEASHNARANEVIAAALQPAADGGYAVEIPAVRAGVWELRFEVTRGMDRFTATLRRDTSRGLPTP